MTLGELIDLLGQLPQHLHLKRGFAHPHSYRGFYADLAFEPIGEQLVSDAFSMVLGALGQTYQGWKGGDFTMHEGVDVYFANEGTCSMDDAPIDCLEVIR